MLKRDIVIDKKLILVLIVIVFQILVSGCNSNDPQSSEKLFTITLQGPLSNSYMFILSSDQTLEVGVGDGFTSLDLNSTDDLNNVTISKINIGAEEYQELLALCSNMEAVDRKIDYSGGWKVNILLYNNKYSFIYGLAPYKNLDTIVTKVIELSPVPIVNGQGYKVEPIN